MSIAYDRSAAVRNHWWLNGKVRFIGAFKWISKCRRVGHMDPGLRGLPSQLPTGFAVDDPGFSDDAWRAVGHAVEEALELGHSSIWATDCFASILRSDSRASSVLARAGVDAEDLLATIRRTTATPTTDMPSGEFPLAASAREIVTQADRVAHGRSIESLDLLAAALDSAEIQQLLESAAIDVGPIAAALAHEADPTDA